MAIKGRLRGDAAQDPATRAVRDHPSHPRRGEKWIKQAGLRFLFPSRIHDSPHLGTRQYARILESWVEKLGLDPADYGTHSMRRTNATLIYRRTKNLRAVTFPNTTVIVRATTVRIDTSIPIAPGITLLEQRGLGIKGESSTDRAPRQEHHNQFWGPFGRKLAEDVIYVEAVERTNRHGASRYRAHRAPRGTDVPGRRNHARLLPNVGACTASVVTT